MRQKLSIAVGAFGPADVSEHIGAIRQIVDGLNVGLRSRDVVLTLHHWTTDSGPGLHPLGPQGKIDDDLNLDQLDIAIFVFWQRFGTPVSDAASGTEHELNNALKRASETGWPRLLTYFDLSRTGVVDGSQLAQVQSLQARLAGSSVLYWLVNDKAHFVNALNVQLRQEIERCISSYENAKSDEEHSLVYSVSCRTRYVRHEGLSEKLGDLAIRVSIPTPDRPSAVKVDITCILSVPIANRLLEGDLTDCTLHDERTGQVLGRGHRINNQSLVFRDLAIVPGPGPQSSRLVVSNLRGAIAGNVSQGGKVFAYLEVGPREGHWFVETQPFEIATARALSGMSWDLTTAEGRYWDTDRAGAIAMPERENRRYLVDEAVAVLRFREGFAGAFSNADQENLGLETEYAPAVLRATFSNVPTGVTIWVSQSDVAGRRGSRTVARAAIIEDEWQTYDCAALGDGFEIREVIVNDEFRRGIAEWAWIDPTTPGLNDEPRTVEFAIFVFGKVDGESAFRVQGTFSPINTTASCGGPFVPIPRFVETGSSQSIPIAAERPTGNS
jgi:hypothetical protein